MNLFLSIGLALALAAADGGGVLATGVRRHPVPPREKPARRLVIPKLSPLPLKFVFREYRRWIDRKLARHNYSTRLFGIHCALFSSPGAKPSSNVRSEVTNRPPAKVYTVTGYCNCGKCCGWENSWFGFGPPVYTSGKLKGQPKQVGITATGKSACHGTVAANPKVLPYGTRLRIPGYGEGTVEDTGGALQGLHIDVWFPTHEEAVKWGVRKLAIRQLQD